jgi:hypothetical protein
LQAPTGPGQRSTCTLATISSSLPATMAPGARTSVNPRTLQPHGAAAAAPAVTASRSQLPPASSEQQLWPAPQTEGASGAAGPALTLGHTSVQVTGVAAPAVPTGQGAGGFDVMQQLGGAAAAAATPATAPRGPPTSSAVGGSPSPMSEVWRILQAHSKGGYVGTGQGLAAAVLAAAGTGSDSNSDRMGGPADAAADPLATCHVPSSPGMRTSGGLAITAATGSVTAAAVAAEGAAGLPPAVGGALLLVSHWESRLMEPAPLYPLCVGPAPGVSPAAPQQAWRS